MTDTEPVNGHYSTLEVDHSIPPNPNDEKEVQHIEPAFIANHGHQNEKTTSHDRADIIALGDPRDEKVLSHDEIDKEAAAQFGSAYEPTIFGLKRKTFSILLATVLVVVVAAIVGGAVGGTAAARNRVSNAVALITTLPPTPAPTRPPYANTGLAALQYTDLNGTLHKRVHYQDNSNKIRESAWDNSSAFDASWQVNNISDAVKPGTPITAATGYPYANYSYALVSLPHHLFASV